MCGKCGSCIDNDRWERIFQKKYGQQERDYYAAEREPRSAGVSAKAFADTSIYAYAEEHQTSQVKVSSDSQSHSVWNFLRTA
jgi:hypothetical protein